MKTKIISASIIILLFIVSCHRPIINSSDDVIYKITGLIVDASENNSVILCSTEDFDSHFIENNEKCEYNKFSINFLFYSEIIGGGQVGTPITNDTIKSITVTSNNDYNDTYSVGDTLNNIIKIKMLKGMICTETGFCENLNDYLLYQPKSNICSFLIFFTEAPSEERLHRFTITYEELSGSKFTDTTNSVFIQP